LAAAFATIAAAFFFVFSRVILQHTQSFVAEHVGRLELEERNRLAHSTSSGHPFHEHPAGHSMNIRPPS
jgi:hypothetical protein